MAVVVIDGMVRVTWATAVASVAAPTVAELNAGTLLHDYITPDGLEINPSTGAVDSSNLGSKFTTQKAGRRKFDIQITMHHNSPTDTPYLLFTYQAAGFIVVRRGVLATTAWGAADKVEVYPVECGEAMQEKPAPDSTWDFTSPFFMTADPNTRAVVA